MFSAGILLVPLLASAAAATGPTPVADPLPPGRNVVHDVRMTAAQQIEVLRYWTADRMLHADPPPVRRERQAAGPADENAGRLRPDRAAATRAAAPSASSRGALWPARGAVRRTEGKVFFTLSRRDYVCSATTVTSHNHDLVVTAGHCAKDGAGAWARNWIFVPGYQDGNAPYGGFTARRMFVPHQWSGRSADDDDVAMVALNRSGGHHVQELVGAQRIAFGRPRGRQVWAFGYPATGSYNGERLAYCAGRPHRDPHRLVADQGLRCDMTQGSSGGAWLADFNPSTGHGVVTSVSSFKYADDSATMYGPYFGATVKALYRQAQAG